jgi:hypothetical protein
MFILVVDDFGIKAAGQEHLDHLLHTLLRLLYTITTGNESKYLEMTLEWEYLRRTVSKSKSGHLAKNFQCFNVILKRPIYLLSWWLRCPNLWIQKSAANGQCRRLRPSRPGPKEYNLKNYWLIFISRKSYRQYYAQENYRARIPPSHRDRKRRQESGLFSAIRCKLSCHSLK